MKHVSGKRMCQVLKAHGWVLSRIEGSHHIHEQPGNPIIISVPVHGDRDMAPGTQRRVMRQTGLTDDDL